MKRVLAWAFLGAAYTAAWTGNAVWRERRVRRQLAALVRELRREA